MPPEAARTVTESMLPGDTAPRSIQSPSSISVIRRPPGQPARCAGTAPPCVPPVVVNHSASQKAGCGQVTGTASGVREEAAWAGEARLPEGRT